PANTRPADRARNQAATGAECAPAHREPAQRLPRKRFRARAGGKFQPEAIFEIVALPSQHQEQKEREHHAEEKEAQEKFGGLSGIADRKRRGDASGGGGRVRERRRGGSVDGPRRRGRGRGGAAVLST